MKIHNIMETYVMECVNTLYDEFSNAKNSFLTCSCENCRLDTVCYVLNRIPPKYVISGRGMTYANLNLNGQTKADIDAMIIDGMKIVNAAQRPYHNKRVLKKQVETITPTFYFPVLFGSVRDGHTFEPLVDAHIELSSNGQLVAMEDVSWENPTSTYKPTKGSFTFKPATVPGNKGETKQFDFTITITAHGYQPLIYSFSIPITASLQEPAFASVKLQDSYMFPVNEVNTMEE